MNGQDDMSEMFDSIPGLTTLQRESAKARYRFLLAEYRWRSWQYAILFYVFRITMTVGSLTVPALLSLKVDGPAGETALYWITWAISLAVTTSNGLMTLFKLDKRFFMLHGVAERLRTETWQYLTLAGRYSGHYGEDEPTHANQYVYYCTNIEKIRMRHMDEEYISVAEGDGKNKPVQGAAAATPHPPVTASSAPPPPPATSSSATGSTAVYASQAFVPGPYGGQTVVYTQAPTLPPPGTSVPFLSPTRTTEIPTPPNPVSRRQSFQRPPPPQPSQSVYETAYPPSQVGNVQGRQDTKEPQETTTAL